MALVTNSNSWENFKNEEIAEYNEMKDTFFTYISEIIKMYYGDESYDRVVEEIVSRISSSYDAQGFTIEGNLKELIIDSFKKMNDHNDGLAAIAEESFENFPDNLIVKCSKGKNLYDSSCPDSVASIYLEENGQR